MPEQVCVQKEEISEQLKNEQLPTDQVNIQKLFTDQLMDEQRIIDEVASDEPIIDKSCVEIVHPVPTVAV